MNDAYLTPAKGGFKIPSEHKVSCLV